MDSREQDQPRALALAQQKVMSFLQTERSSCRSLQEEALAVQEAFGC
jgi:hypothetical protein